MKVKVCVHGLAAMALAAALSGCAPYPLPGPLVYGKCGADGHTESYPLAEQERHAYGCKSDSSGYLEGASQGDRPRN